MRIHGVALLVVVIAGCGTDSPPPGEPRSRVDLRAAIPSGADDVNVIGVAITPDGQRFVFDEVRGLYRIDGSTATVVVRMNQLPVPNVPIQLPITDVVAIAPDLFALTAIGDGFLLDISAMTMTQHFCYVPDGTPENLTQITEAIAYDPTLDRIYAQPRTFNGPSLVSAQIAGYVRESGQLIDWHDVDPGIEAGGMAVIPNIGLVLGQGSRVDHFDAETRRTDLVADLASYGVSWILGLAYDADAGTLLVVDGNSDELVEIALD